MQIETEGNGKTVCLKLTGDLTFESIMNFRQSAKAWLDKPVQEIAIDLSGVDFIDSTGIGTLIGLKSSCTAKQKKLVLRNPRKQVCDTLAVMRLQLVFNIEHASSV